MISQTIKSDGFFKFSIEKHGCGNWHSRSTHRPPAGSPAGSPLHVLQEGAGYDPPTGVEEGEEDEFEHEMEVCTSREKDLPSMSKYVKIVLENGPVEIVSFPIKTQNNGKSQCWIGKSPIFTSSVNSFSYVYQRVLVLSQ